jgi:hypothetical protein
MNQPQSDKVQELIHKARIINFATWHNTHSAAVLQLFQNANDQGRYLRDQDLQQIQQLAPSTAAFLPSAQLLRDCADQIVNEARSHLLQTFPTITQLGGELDSPERVNACWRDFWHFLRCITYGIAGQYTNYTSPEGLHHLQLLYRELRVPLDAMITGLEGIKAASLRRVDPQQSANLAPYFDHLIEQLKQFH